MDLTSLVPSSEKEWEEFNIKLERIIEEKLEKLIGIECVEVIMKEI